MCKILVQIRFLLIHDDDFTIIRVMGRSEYLSLCIGTLRYKSKKLHVRTDVSSLGYSPRNIIEFCNMAGILMLLFVLTYVLELFLSTF